MPAPICSLANVTESNIFTISLVLILHVALYVLNYPSIHNYLRYNLYLNLFCEFFKGVKIFPDFNAFSSITMKKFTIRISTSLNNISI